MIRRALPFAVLAVLWAASVRAEETAADYLRRRAAEYGEKAAAEEKEAAGYRRQAEEHDKKARELRRQAADFEKALKALGSAAAAAPAASAAEAAAPVPTPAAAGNASEEAEGADAYADAPPPAAARASGALVPLGGGAAHLAIEADENAGTIAVRLLDADGKTALPLEQETLSVKIRSTTTRGDGYGFALTLRREGGAFRAESSNLRDMDAFTGKFDLVRAKGRDYEDVGFRYPK